jgi:uncharacterized protein YuzE
MCPSSRLIDLEAEGHLIGIEILEASVRVGIRDLVKVGIENLPLEMVEQG